MHALLHRMHGLFNGFIRERNFKPIVMLDYQSVYGWVVAQALQYGNSFDELEWALLIYIE